MPFDLKQSGFSGGELSPAIYARHDLEKFSVGLKQAINVILLKQGGFAKRPGTMFVAEVKDSDAETRILPFRFNTTQTYILEFGNLYMRVIRDNGQVLTDAAVSLTAATQANPVVVTSAGHGFSDGDEVFVTGVVGMTQLNNRNFVVASAGANTFALQGVDGSAFSAYVSGGTADAVYEITTPYTTAQLQEIDYVQSADTMYIVHPDHAPRKLQRTDHNAWTISSVTFVPTFSAPASISASASVGSGSTTYEYTVTAVSALSGEESLPGTLSSTTNDLTTSGNRNQVTWSAVTDAARYRVYKKENGVFRFAGFTTATSFLDENIDPDDNDTPPESTTLFSATGDYPGAVHFFEQRLAFAGSDNEPQTIWMGRSEALENFTQSVITQPNDAITVRLFGQDVSRIRFLVELNELFILTSGSERSLRGNDGFLSPTNGIRSNISTRGTGTVRPIIVGSDILFVQEVGETVFEKEFAGFDGQGRSLYRERELTVMSEHLFRNRQIKRWAYGQSPDSLLMCATSDATGLCMTYHKEHDIWGWTQLSMGGSGAVEDVASIRDGSYDAHYSVVKRTINGATRRYIERVSDRYITAAEDSLFLDSSLTYDGSAATTISGLHHLEGASVVALADGAVVGAQTVADGEITLSKSASKVHVGFSYRGLVETLPPHISLRSGSSQGKQKRIPSVTVGYRDSRGIKIGPDLNNLVDLIKRNDSGVIPLQTGQDEMPNAPEWGRDVSLFLVSDDPLPMEVTHITPEVEVGG